MHHASPDIARGPRLLVRRCSTPALIRSIVLAASLSYFTGVRAESLTVFAAASLADALPAITKQFSADTDCHIRFSFAGSSILARQLINGARAHLFVSADQTWADYLESHSRFSATPRRDLIANRLVVVAGLVAGKPMPGTIEVFELVALLNNDRLATGDPDHVPAGRYARAALEHFGLWRTLAPRLARYDSVRGALAAVERGEAPLGIVYASDTIARRQLRTLMTFPSDSHPAIIYPMVLLAADPQARALYDYLRAAARQGAFAKYGFSTAAENN